MLIYRKGNKAKTENNAKSPLQKPDEYKPRSFYYDLSIYPPQIHAKKSRRQQGFGRRRVNIGAKHYEDVKPIYKQK